MHVSFNFRNCPLSQSAKRNVEKTVIAARQDMRQLMLNKLRTHPLTWARRNPLKQFLR